MKAQGRVSVGTQGNVGIIGITSRIPKNPTERLMIVGSSISASVKSGVWVTSFQFEMGDGDSRAVFAVRAEMFDGENCHFFIPVYRKSPDKKISIEPEEFFFPDSGRLGQMYPDGRIEVVVGNIAYTNWYNHKTELQPDAKEYRLVDADSLCKYMLSEIDLAKLERASEGHICSISQESCIESLRVEKEQLKGVVSGLRKDVDELNKKADKLERFHEEVVSMLRTAENTWWYAQVVKRFCGKFFRMIEEFKIKFNIVL